MMVLLGVYTTKISTTGDLYGLKAEPGLMQCVRLGIFCIPHLGPVVCCPMTFCFIISSCISQLPFLKLCASCTKYADL